jgi:hypothetical protein
MELISILVVLAELAFTLLIAQQHHLLLQQLAVLQLLSTAIKPYLVNQEVLTS